MGRGNLGLGSSRLGYGRMLLEVRSTLSKQARLVDGSGRTKRYPIRSVMKTLLVPAINDPRELATKISETVH